MKRRLLALVLGVSLLFTACGNTNTADTQSAEPTVDERYLDASLDVETRIEALVSSMTLEEKAAQMLQPEQAEITPEEVKEYGIGSVLSGGGSCPSTGNNPENWQERVNDLKQAAKDSRLHIPLIYGIDAVHGNNNVFGSVVYPHNIGLGAAADADLMKEIGIATAKEVRAIGVQWDFAPCMGNPQDVSWGRTYECFSEKTEDIVPLISAYISGLQGDIKAGEIMKNTSVVACAKHYIGEGYTVDGINQGNVDMTPEEFDELLSLGILDPYKAAVNQNVLTVMPSYNSVNGVKCHENYHLLTEVLKEQLGFKGFVISDYNAIQQTSGATYYDQIALSINAGVDMLMEVSTWRDCINGIVENVKNGKITEERIDDAVSRILYVKFVAGLFEEEIGGATEQDLLANYGSDESRELARRAVRESLVCLKNDKVGKASAIEALKDATNVTICGSKAFDLGDQCGGWTITWQGQSGNKITNGTTIIQGIHNQIKDYAKVNHSVDGTLAEGTDAVVVVIGEKPYAETDGDRSKKADICASADDKEMMEKLLPNLEKLPKDVPVILVVVAGRPINIETYVDTFDGVVMAWLPGTEGQGVADVLFGDYDFTGTLKFTWQKDELTDALFTYGTGLNKAGESIK